MRVYFTVILLNFFCCYGYSQVSTITGSVTSLKGAPLLKSHILIEPDNNELLFNSQKITVSRDGDFTITIPKAGLYNVTVLGVLHKSLRFPLWIREPDSLNISIKLDPKNLDDGTYFESDEYLSWIRVTGNFNGYNYDQGVRFKRVTSRKLRAVISTSLDTIRYQIVGLTSGTTVLPGADDYALRDRYDYEAVQSVHDNKVILTYKSDSTYFPDQNPYEGYRNTWDPNQSIHTFSTSLEERIHNNLGRDDFFKYIFDYSIFDSVSIPRDHFRSYMDSIREKKHERFRKDFKQIEQQLENTIILKDTYLRQSLAYKYLNQSSFLKNVEREEIQEYINPATLRTTLDIMPPSSPLWSTDLLDIYPEVLGYTPNVVSYFEQVITANSGLNIAGALLLDLFKSSYDIDGRSESTKKYYRDILQQFGDDYYARKAREYVQK